jgi:hypothetical protein
VRIKRRRLLREPVLAVPGRPCASEEEYRLGGYECFRQEMDFCPFYSQSVTSKNHGPGATWTMDNQDGMRIPDANGIRNGQRLITWTFCKLTKKLFEASGFFLSTQSLTGTAPRETA